MFKTRLKTNRQRLSWGIIYLIPVFLMTWWFGRPEYPFVTILAVCALALIVVYTLYEAGYIQNDTEAIKAEAFPTHRLSAPAIAYYKKRKGGIYGCRVVIALAGLGLLSVLVDRQNLLDFGGLMALMVLLYQVYNGTHGRWKIGIHLLLVIIRFMAIPLLLRPALIHSSAFWCMLLLFPVPNLIERASEAKFNFRMARSLTQNRQEIDCFRFYYYLVVSAGAMMLWIFSGWLNVFGLLSFYFLCYRSLIYWRVFSFAGRT